MAKTKQPRTFSEAVSNLGSHEFDVGSVSQGAAAGSKALPRPGAVQVRKYGCAAEIAAAPDGTVLLLARPGWLLGGQIARLVDRGYQKFLKAGKLEIPATAEHLRAIHEFSEELKQAAGATSLYNESLGTTSDVYLYDRIKGRE
jgi:hypothetical protein